MGIKNAKKKKLLEWFIRMGKDKEDGQRTLPTEWSL